MCSIIHCNHRQVINQHALHKFSFLQASSRIWAFGHLLCTLVNWKVLRDTALNFCLKRLLGLNTFPDKEDVPMTCIEIAAKILEAVDPWMEHNWGYTSSRHLDAYYFRMQHWCERQIFWSNMPEGCFVDLPFCHDILVISFIRLCQNSEGRLICLSTLLACCKQLCQ